MSVRIDEKTKKIIYGPRGFRIRIPIASCSLAAGVNSVRDAVVNAIESLGLEAEVYRVGCMGQCFIDPWIEIAKEGLPPAIYGNIDPNNASKIKEMIQQYVNGDLSEAMAVRFKVDGIKSPPELTELDPWKYQVRFVSRNCGLIDPESIEDYIATGGYSGLKRALEMKREEVIEEIKRSKLRGRGGAGFPTWLKWNLCYQQKSDVKYVICNGDEGDPGAFMNRLLSESDPHRVVEGLIIAGYAVGATNGVIFVRAEKPLMAERLAKAVQQAREKGFLGKNILGTDFSFDIVTYRSAGAFVCGEETALIAAIEGRSRSRQRPPYPAVKGLWGKPTILNNVETLAHVATIFQFGVEEFVKYGTERTGGTKMFCVTGSVKRTGVYEVPIGTTIRRLIYDLAGGAKEGKNIKAVQAGGPSGGCIPVELFDVQLDFETLQQYGAIMGSGGLVVIDDSMCMVDVAHFFTGFTLAESCGKCLPCRVGVKLLNQILGKIKEGEGKIEDLETLQEIGESIMKTSLCALGGTAPNPVISTLKYFKHEYLEHIERKHCAAKVCQKLVTYVINPGLCNGCGTCLRSCPSGAIEGKPRDAHKIIAEKCLRCGQCMIVCPAGAVGKV